MFRVLAFTAALFLFSGLVLLLVDHRVYKVRQMQKEQTYARFFGWVQLSLASVSLLISLIMQ
ncbi:CLC_0170 family protein [Paenibacillus timonensis]|uniref:CLC_0170 family protein n=1 Tax=Paenibacillus timonensis TaxID=225915 RepID=UPI003F9DFA6E